MASVTGKIQQGTQPEDPSPDSIEQRLGQLIRYYLETRSPAIASSVVRHIEILCACPGFDGDSRQRCAYLRMKAHWRWLASAPHVIREL